MTKGAPSHSLEGALAAITEPKKIPPAIGLEGAFSEAVLDVAEALAVSTST
jgi:hypothetical protein